MDEEQIASLADDIYGKVMLRLTRDDDVDPSVPEYVAVRLIDAIEWGSPHYEFTNQIAEHIVDTGELLSDKVKAILRKHFDL